MSQTSFLRCDLVAAIILSDPIPECCKATWPAVISASVAREPPPDAQYSTTSLYKCLVPRLPPDFTTSRSISAMPDSALVFFYEDLSSTATCLRDYAKYPQHNELFIEKSIFHIVVSDTLGLLHLLHNMRGDTDTISAAVSQTALLKDILSLRPFIANLQPKPPLLNVELAQALQALMGLFPGEETHRSASSQVSARF
ncbi:hypothetical protein BJY01DRAFT_150473 [Aspergillus pseudoustus]|uniref:Stress-response A/B barrel domain-containing protein n=1 Tax=Aspergillus pseudoustus TaxID=1810923 RepID=A0ABR4IEG7_9EURO